MAANWNLPTVASTYVNLVAEIDARLDDLAIGLDTAATNLPTNAKKFSTANNRWEKWNGSAWVVLSTTYAINVDQVDGYHANATATAGQIPVRNGSGKVDNVDVATGVSGTLPAANGGTGLTSYAVGDLIYASGTTTLAKLADVATGNALLSGGVGGAPAWGKVGLTTHVSGTLAVGNGGTGVTTLSGLAYGNGTGAFTVATAAQVVGVISTTAVTNATNATNLAVTNDTTTNATYYPAFAVASTGNAAQKVSSTKLTFNPSTGTLTATAFSGNLNMGNAASGTLAVARGGTGGTTQATARSGIGAAASGAVGSSGLTMNTGKVLGRTTPGSGPIEELDGNFVPTGTVLFFAAATTPSGFLECSGAAISRTTYAALFAIVGTTYGSGDGSTTFNLPDLRGEFIRGHDNGRGVDAARAIGSAQADEVKSHQHVEGYRSAATVAPAFGVSGTSTPAWRPTLASDTLGNNPNTSSTGGTETRPRNVALRPCIKY